MPLAPTYTGQWAQATFKAVAANTATLNITAVAGSVSTWTYTFTVTQGSIAAALSGGFLYVKVTGMQNGANNGNWRTVNFDGTAGTMTAFTATTFTVTNASGVAESGSSGTGQCASDSGMGPAVYVNATLKQGYTMQSGTNSFGGDGRLGFNELWRVAAPLGADLIADAGFPGVTILPPSVNDIIAVAAENGVVTGYKNGIVYARPNDNALYSFADATYTSGSIGMTGFSVAGPNEYNFGQWNQNPGIQGATGNSGTTIGDFKGGPVNSAILQSDLVPYANGDLHTANANWVYDNGTYTVLSNAVYCSAAAAFPFNVAHRSDASPGADQYAECVVIIGTNSGVQNGGPAVRIGAGGTTYYALQLANNISHIVRASGGVLTVIRSSTVAAVTGDRWRITARANVITAWRNGIAMGSVIDNTLSSGNVGMVNAGNATLNGFTAWAGGNYVWQQTGSDTFAPVGPFGPGYIGPISTTFEGIIGLTLASQTIVAPNQVGPAAANGGDSIIQFNGGTAQGGSPGPPGGGDLGPGYDFKFRM
jgi:hypothetical protein